MREFSKLLQGICIGLLLASSFAALAATQNPTIPAPVPNSKTPLKQPPALKISQVTRADLTAVGVPQTPTPCPLTLHFAGSITTNGPATVKYTWVRNDGINYPPVTLRLTSAGTQRVSQDWRLGAARTTVRGWLQVKILSPNALASNQADFKIMCK